MYRSEQYKFEDWRLAFEVDLKFEEYEVLKTTSTSFASTFQDSFAYRQTSSSTNYILKHIYMDLESKNHTYTDIPDCSQSLFTRR